MSILLAIFLGIVQGVTEFLPVSSSGHLSIFQNLFGLNYSESDNLFFDVLLHVGTLLAICIVYRNDLKAIWVGLVQLIRGEKTDAMYSRRLTPPVRLLVFIIVATLPLFLAVPFNDKISALFGNTLFVGCALIVTGFILLLGDIVAKKGTKNAKTMTIWDALIIGVCQVLALFPGVSRSGTTITAGTVRGLDRKFAVRFSLLMSIPAILGSTLLTLADAVSAGIDTKAIPAYLIGFIVSAAVGLVSINLLRRITSKGKFGKFRYYCWGMGVLTVILTLILK